MENQFDSNAEPKHHSWPQKASQNASRDHKMENQFDSNADLKHHLWPQKATENVNVQLMASQHSDTTERGHFKSGVATIQSLFHQKILGIKDDFQRPNDAGFQKLSSYTAQGKYFNDGGATNQSLLDKTEGIEADHLPVSPDKAQIGSVKMNVDEILASMRQLAAEEDTKKSNAETIKTPKRDVQLIYNNLSTELTDTVLQDFVSKLKERSECELNVEILRTPIGKPKQNFQLIACFNVSRLYEDAVAAIQGYPEGCMAALLIFRHKEEHTRRITPAYKILSDSQFQKLFGIFDFVFSVDKAKCIYKCDVNNTSFEECVLLIEAKCQPTGIDDLKQDCDNRPAGISQHSS